MRTVAVLFTFHMAATFLPLLVLPEYAFKFVPFAPTMEGQYIIKNLVLVSAGWAVLAPYFKGFRLFSRPHRTPSTSTPTLPSTPTA